MRFLAPSGAAVLCARGEPTLPCELDRTGNVLADFDTPVSDTRPAPSKQFYGPFDPAISPDGKKVAYSFFWMTQSQRPSLCATPTASG